jgi:dipeptidyl-peptidase 4
MNQTIPWADRYARIQQLLLLQERVHNAAIYPRWMGRSDAFWYERSSQQGKEICIVQAASGAKRTAFAVSDVANLLARVLGTEVDPERLILGGLKVECESPRAAFDVFGKSWIYEYEKGVLREAAIKTSDRSWLISPNGRRAAILRDHNVWVRDIETGKEKALTTDGTETHAYADRPATLRAMRAKLGLQAEGIWSPDSRRFLTLQADDRHVPELAMVDFVPTEGLRPQVSSNRTSLPGDERVTEFRMISIDVASGRQVEARYPRLSAVRMNDTPFSAGLAWWSADSRTAYFVDLQRGEKTAHVVAFDAETGITRVVLSEHSATYLEMGVNVYAPALVFPLLASNELIWYSERSGYGHLYLYDLGSGRFRRPITSGPWAIREVLGVDEARREVFVAAAGIAAEEGPYVCKPAIASLDNGKTTVVSTEPGEHVIWRSGEYRLVSVRMAGQDTRAISGLAPNGSYFVETVGAPDRLPSTVLRRRNGEQVAVIEVADDTALPEDWTWPEAVRLVAADGKASVYGLLFKPPGYDPEKRYPVIDYIYGGPQLSLTPRIAFGDGAMNGAYLEAAALATLGAFAVVMDGRGTAERERSFRDASYGAIHTASNLEDHACGIRQLAERYPAMDLERVGICGFSGGGYASALAALHYGDFFKVAVAAGGNYDQALFWHGWGERYQGLYDPKLYGPQAAKSYAAELKGKLLLIHGLKDTGCHPAALFQLIQALVESNKDVDLVLLPRAGHELTGYGVRRRLDYFVTHLFGSTPPPAVEFRLAHDELLRRIAASAAHSLQKPTDSRVPRDSSGIGP